MAEVIITITGKESSRVKVRFNPGTSNAVNLTMNTTWAKVDWEAMLTDDATATAAAKTMGANVADLRAGIRSLQEQAKQMGSAVYRAWCGLEMYDRTDGTRKPKVIDQVRMGHVGDERHEQADMRVEAKPPEACLNCPKLKADVRNYKIRDDYKGPRNNSFLFPQTSWVCKTFALVPGAVPPPEKEEEAK